MAPVISSISSSVICRSCCALITLVFIFHPELVFAQDPEQLWQAARRGDLEKVQEIVESGVDVNARTDYGATAISFAADRGHLEIVNFLLAKNADPNVEDRFYHAVPMDWAAMHEHHEIMKALALGGAKKIEPAVSKAVTEKDIEFLKAISTNRHLTYRLAKTQLELAKTTEFEQGVKLFEPLVEKLKPTISVSDEQAKKYSGNYLLDKETLVEIGKKEIFLTVKWGRRPAFEVDFLAENRFSGNGIEIEFVESKDAGLQMKWTASGETQLLNKLGKEKADEIRKKNQELADDSDDQVGNGFVQSSQRSRAEDLSVSSEHWPQFRGTGARGIADGQNPPVEWNAAENQNLKWKTRIPGLGHSCPVIWGDFVLVTTAISETDASIRTGLYGDVESVQDDSEHEFVTFCIDKQTGKIVWQQTAVKAVPKVKRHLKSTHANSSVATDGKFVVSWFASEGVYCYSMEGKQIWKKDLGLLDSGWFYDREYQWQFGASPVIHEGKLILQCDIQDQSFLTCLELATGKQIWKTERDEIPSWSTPTVVETPNGKVIVTNATKAARGYDFETGEQIWQIEKNSEIAVPTPFMARNLIFVSSGYRPVQPIYAIRLDAAGDLTLEKSLRKSEYIAWSEPRGGPYMPTPLVYGDYLYICSNSGILTCYQATTGKQVYKKRLRMKGIRSFVGSPIAADGHLYLTSEDGETAVIKAGPKFQVVSNNFCGENCLTTAAISEKTFFLRAQKHLFAFAMESNVEKEVEQKKNAVKKPDDAVKKSNKEKPSEDASGKFTPED